MNLKTLRDFEDDITRKLLIMNEHKQNKTFS